jgi:hypothetical protein
VNAAEIRSAAKTRQAERNCSYREAVAHVKAQSEVDEWNSTYPIGTPVIMSPYTGCPEAERVTTVTTSKAWIISEHASVLIEGKSGGYGLAWVKPIKAP